MDRAIYSVTLRQICLQVILQVFISLDKGFSMGSFQDALRFLPPSKFFVNKKSGVVTSYRMSEACLKVSSNEKSKPPLVFLHGFNGSSKSWSQQISYFNENVVIAIDAPGFGGSHVVGDSMAAIANETAGLIRNLDLGPAIIIGHSMGGMQAQIIASKHPDLCAGLVLSCTHKGHAHPFGTPLDKALMERIHQREMMDDSTYGRIRIQKMLARDIAPEIFSFLASVAGEVRAEGIISGGTAMHHLDTTSLLKRITAPVMILTGEKDIVVSATAGAALRACLPDARHIQLTGVGHAPYCEDVPQFNAALSRFLKSV